MSFIDYKTIVRIENAKKLLSDPSATISEVARRSALRPQVLQQAVQENHRKDGV